MFAFKYKVFFLFSTKRWFGETGINPKDSLKQFEGSDHEYNYNKPRSAACDIVRFQKRHDAYMDFLEYHIAENRDIDNVSIRIISGVY